MAERTVLQNRVKLEDCSQGHVMTSSSPSHAIAELQELVCDVCSQISRDTGDLESEVRKLDQWHGKLSALTRTRDALFDDIAALLGGLSVGAAWREVGILN